jgi:two-component system LytT family response regulator
MLGIASIDKIEVVNIDAIVYIQADGRYTHFHLLDGSKKTASKNLGEYEKILPIEDFVRVHHSYIVNMSYVKSIQKTDGYFVQLFKSDTLIPIAKRKQDTINKFLRLKN